ncbi:DUF3775 domain-containing protein (plasmid) [Rhizobium sp. WW22]|uniref:DUF3775 domain-containing protein n=1 Tax=unclassified Rhizobium TaxID=2613769 RepID=UPI000DDAF89D|nr:MULTISPECIES: DUF3775 domain-containing protein [unclassified Rhizobium]MBB3387133.1 hypothetical protein [Rhizobium sp. BK098]MBB3618827.1 hypothetical protein [Rhizobium sp. BK609]MBB3684494.1 hypothetical protein [Rhizobium sp. BK612]
MKKIDDDRPVWPMTITPEKVCYFILKARQFDAKDAPSDWASSSNPADDGMIDVLEDRSDDPVQEELRSAIWALNVDEKIDLVALVWLGRGDGTVSDWPDIRSAAMEAQNNHTAAYLLGTPLLGDYLEEALSMFGESCQAIENGHL